jgi:hypothetical protein
VRASSLLLVSHLSPALSESYFSIFVTRNKTSALPLNPHPLRHLALDDDAMVADVAKYRRWAEFCALPVPAGEEKCDSNTVILC